MAARSAAREVVALGRACDNACVFCAQEGLARESVTDLALPEPGAAGVTFAGGEPGIDERLEELVAKARAAGHARIGVQTNGRALSAPGRIEALARAGLTDVHLSLHGSDARVHDWHTGAPGSFDAALKTLAAARAAGLRAVVVTVLTRSNFRVLAPLPRMLASRGVAGWCIDVPRWRGRAQTHADRVVPRLALALPFALHAIDAAEALGLTSFVRGAPACLLGPFASRALPESEPRAFADVCTSCPSRGACAGVDAQYVARFGAGELAPRPPFARETRAPELATLFVGAGEMAPLREDLPVHPPPERARVSLPVMGRPAPAHAEVPASAPKQTGEALKAILPDLFAGKRGER
ncbi:MAG TPA: radical SAM protein [Polyangiaceae bacterium]